MNRVAAVLLVTSIGLALAGLWATRPVEKTGGTLVVDPISCDFGTMVVKQRKIVRVQFRNESSSTARILGAAGYCTRKGCLSSRGLPVRVDPGETVSVPVEVLPHLLGPFAQELRFYSDVPGRRSLDVTIRGSVTADPAANPPRHAEP